jgi:hypothetical protein
MTDNYFTRFTEWQNYVHYILLTIALIVFAHFLGIHTFHTDIFLPNLNALYLLLFIFVADSIIHAIFWYLPEDYGRWRD